jgi:single-strand DNA-binding protein
MYNKIILIGRLTADPEIRYTGNGTPVAKFTLACTRPFQNQNGERETDFIDVVTWSGLAETCSNYTKKGYMVTVEGRLQIRSYDDKQGIRRKAAEVVADGIRFLDRGKNGNATTNSNATTATTNGTHAGHQSVGQQTNSQPEDEFSEIPFADDDLPF